MQSASENDITTGYGKRSCRKPEDQGLACKIAAIGLTPFRGDSAFASPKLMKLLEVEGYWYAIRLKANAVLERNIVHLLRRPVGRPSKKSMAGTGALLPVPAIVVIVLNKLLC